MILSTPHKKELHILLVIILIVMSVIFNKAKSNEVWPPFVSNCPDYWVDLSGNGGNCVNVKDLGKCNATTSGNEYMLDISGNSSICTDISTLTRCALPNSTNQEIGGYLFNIPGIEKGICADINNLTKCSKTPNMDFTQSPFTGSNGDCAKYTWATDCNVSWDGITYGVVSPCNTSSTSEYLT